jgi:hypothetical protein
MFSTVEMLTFNSSGILSRLILSFCVLTLADISPEEALLGI